MPNSSLLAPWDEIAYFEAPTETTFTLNGSQIQVATANSRRVLLAVANVAQNGIWISTKPNGGANQGLFLQSTQGPLVINHARFGPLTQVEWYAFCPAFGLLTVYEVVLTKWPQLVRQPS